MSPVTALGRWLRGPAEQCDAVGRARTIRPFTTGEVACILATARKFYPRYYPLFLTLARTGCRPGEALALRWSDLNFTRREILIVDEIQIGIDEPAESRHIGARNGKTWSVTRCMVDLAIYSRH